MLKEGGLYVKKTSGNDYTAKSIQVLEGLEAIRKRPGMYIGGTGLKSLHHMIYEVVDNSIDEALMDACNKISVELGADGAVCVSDNGRGIPVEEHPSLKKSALEIIFTTLHSGGKFGGDDSYKRAGGLHGVGLSVVNALSCWVEVTANKNSGVWFLRFERGVPVGKVKKIGKGKETGTKIKFMPDPAVFDSTEFCFDTLEERLKEMAFLTPAVSITLVDERQTPHRRAIYNFPGGLKQFMASVNCAKETLHKEILHGKGEKDGVSIEFAVQYTDEYSESIYSFVNNIKTRDGGTHEQGFKSALSRSLKGLSKDRDSDLSVEDLREGLTAILSVRMTDPKFEGQTKGKLENSEVKGIVESVVYERLVSLLTSSPSTLSAIVKKAREAARAREAAKRSREVRKKNSMEVLGLSSKLAQCSSKNAEECELFLVEGDSAGGSAKQGRNPQYQAILPLKGKILNCEKSRVSKILSNEEIRSIIFSIGAGIEKTLNLKEARYKKIIIMTDADVDGEHIRTLLLTFFYRFMKPLIESGNLYIARPPLYRIQGKTAHYAYSEKEKDALARRMGGKVEITRYKGLGEMDAEQLWNTTMNPETRVLIRVTEEDALHSDVVFSTLMGSATEPRKAFVEKHAKKARLRPSADE